MCVPFRFDVVVCRHGQVKDVCDRCMGESVTFMSAVRDFLGVYGWAIVLLIIALYVLVRMDVIALSMEWWP